jgi:hypothetical protein
VRGLRTQLRALSQGRQERQEAGEGQPRAWAPILGVQAGAAAGMGLLAMAFLPPDQALPAE